MPDVRERDFMYNLIIRQLSYDGHQQFALDLSKIIGLALHPLPPSDELFRLMAIAKQHAKYPETRQKKSIRQICTTAIPPNVANCHQKATNRDIRAPTPDKPTVAGSSLSYEQSPWVTVSSSKHRHPQMLHQAERPPINSSPCQPETSAKRLWHGESRTRPKQPRQDEQAGKETKKDRYDNMMRRLLDGTDNISPAHRNHQLHQIATWLLLREAAKVVMESNHFLDDPTWKKLIVLRAEVSDLVHNSGLCLPHPNGVLRLQNNFYLTHEHAITQLSKRLHFTVKTFI